MSGRVVTTSRGVQLAVGVVHVLLGVALAISLNHYIRDFPILLGRKWYDSYWLPLWVACLIYVAEAVRARLRTPWLYGLLITVPPYGWHAGLATVLYLENRSDVTASEYLKIALPALLLALSGGILNTVIARLVWRLRKNPTPKPASASTTVGDPDLKR